MHNYYCVFAEVIALGSAKPNQDPFKGIEDKDIDSVHDFKLYYLNDDNQSVSSYKQHMII